MIILFLMGLGLVILGFFLFGYREGYRDGANKSKDIVRKLVDKEIEKQLKQFNYFPPGRMD